MAGIKEIKEFIDYAERNRKYAPETARARRAALALFEQVLNEDEINSVEMIRERFEQIYSNVFQKNKLKATASSLKIYKSRVNALLKEFTQYGSDPDAFGSWDITRKTAGNRDKNKAISTKTKSNTVSSVAKDQHINNIDKIKVEVQVPEEEPTESIPQDINTVSIKLYIRKGYLVDLKLPSDLTRKEASRLLNLIDGIAIDNDAS